MYHCLSAIAVLHNRDRIVEFYSTALDTYLARLAASQIETENDLHLTLEWILEMDVQFNLQNVLTTLQITPEQLGPASFHDVMHHVASVGVVVLPSPRTQDCMEKAGEYAKIKGWTDLSSALLDGVKTLRTMTLTATQAATQAPTSTRIQ
jgi:hypothetical protein